MVQRLLITLFAISAASSYAADVAYSPVVGGIKITVPAGQTRSIAFPLSHYSAGTGAMVGQISAVGSSYIDVTNAGWTAGALSNAANPYYLRFTSGNAAGRTLLVSTTTANTSTRLTVLNDNVDLTSSGGPAAGDSYEIILADTLASFFGDNTQDNPLTVQGGASYDTADLVQIWGGASWQVFYFNTTRNRWELNGNTNLNANNRILRPDQGIIFKRRASTALEIYLTGRVPVTGSKPVHSIGGVTFVSHGFPVDIKLSALALRTIIPSWQGAASSTLSVLPDADIVQVWSGSSWLVFYYNTTRSRWEQMGNPNLSADNYNLAAGTPFMIRRIGASSKAVIPFALPYTI